MRDYKTNQISLAKSFWTKLAPDPTSHLEFCYFTIFSVFRTLLTLAPKEALNGNNKKKDCAMFYFLCHKDFIFGGAFRLIARLIDYGLRIEAHFEAGLILRLLL